MKWQLQGCLRAAAALICVANAAVISFAAVQPAAAQVPKTQAPVDENAPPSVCLGCHGLAVLAHMRQGEEGWRAIVDYMVLHGAYMTPAEHEDAVGWLTRNYGLAAPREVPLNTASQDPDFDLLVKNCTSCHSLERITHRKRTPAAWAQIVVQMRAIGAHVPDSEAVRIVRYLGKNL
jgi:hypothetical protein